MRDTSALVVLHQVTTKLVVTWVGILVTIAN